MIQDVYYFSLCHVTYKHKNFYTNNIEPRWAYILPNVTGYMSSDYGLQYAKQHLCTYSTLEEILARRAKVQQEWRAKFLPGHTRVFIIVKWQEPDFRNDMTTLGLDQYKVYESDWAINANYPETGPNLKMFIYHIPKENQ